MPLNGSAIRKQTFRKKLQGIDQAEVSRFLEEVAAELDRLLSENADLSRRVTEAETQLKDFRSVEKALQQTLMQAQDSTARSIEQARREAQLIIQDAEMKGAGIVEKSRGELSTLKEQITILSAKRESLVSKLRMLLTSELEMVDSLEGGEPAPPAAPPGPEAPHAGGQAPPQADQATIDDIVNSLDKP